MKFPLLSLRSSRAPSSLAKRASPKVSRKARSGRAKRNRRSLSLALAERDTFGDSLLALREKPLVKGAHSRSLLVLRETFGDSLH